MWFIYASSAAFCFGLRGILYQWTSRKPINRNLLLLGVYLSGTLVALLLQQMMRQSWSKGAYLGLLMGAFSYVSNSAMYKGYSVGKASLVAVFTGLPPVVVVGTAYLLWGERLSRIEMAAFLIIIGGIVMIRYSNDVSWKNLQGIQWALLSMFFFGFTDIFSKQAMRLNGQLLPTLILMYSMGSLLFLVTWLVQNQRAKTSRALGRWTISPQSAKETAAVAGQWKGSRTVLWGLVVGITNISGMLLILPAFKLGVTGLVSTVMALNVMLIILYARIVLKDKWSRREIGGIFLAFLGMVLLRLFG